MEKIKMKQVQTILAILFVIVITLGVHTNTVALPLYGKLNNVKYFNENGQEGVFIYFDNIQKHNDFTLSNPDRIIVDFEYSLYNGASKTINISSSTIKAIRYAQFKKNVVRVVFDLLSKQEYKIEQGNGYIKVYISNTSQTGNSGNNQNIKDNNQDIKRDDDRNSSQSGRGNVDRNSITLPDNINISYVARESVDEVSISLGNHKDYNISTLAQPERIIVDIPNVEFSKGEQEFPINGNLVKSIRSAQYQDNLGRLVLDLNEKSLYRVNDTEGKLILSLEKPTYKNISYGSIGYNSKNDRIFFSIKGAKLTEGGKDLKRHYTGRYDSTRFTYTITFPSEYANLSSGIMKINDHMFESVTIAKNLIRKQTSLIFKAKDKFVYEIITRPDVNDTVINILKPVSNSEKLVVIDAGHGGTEPGAVYGKLMEKDLNLDIAIRLNELLKAKNIKTYMIREDDSFVGLYERAFIANSLNAKLFLSIHNNAIGDPNFDGTMTLYNVKSSEGRDFNSYNFARIIQNSLLKTLGSKNRNLRERPDLVVLKATKMPAALAEIAFLTNKGDRNKLQTPEYRQKVAQALCDAIIESLSKVK